MSCSSSANSSTSVFKGIRVVDFVLVKFELTDSALTKGKLRQVIKIASILKILNFEQFKVKQGDDLHCS
jgi:hypothetical protein